MLSGNCMKQTITILLLTISSFTTYGQIYSFTIDSLTTKHINLLPKNQQKYFTNMLKNRKTIHWLNRIDTAKFDYAFVEETFCDYNQSSTIAERYFIRPDTLPKNVFINGNVENPTKAYDGFFIWYSKNVTYLKTYFPLFAHYSELKSTQELPYQKRQIWTHGCVIRSDDKKKLINKRTKQLKTTYQIQTMVDKVNNKIVVSVQFAPKKPIFETRGYNPVWDW